MPRPPTTTSSTSNDLWIVIGVTTASIIIITIIIIIIKRRQNRTPTRRDSSGVADDNLPLQRTPRRRQSNRVPQTVSNPNAAHSWVYQSSDFDTTPASDESRHGAVLHRLDTSTTSSFSPINREPIACSSPRRLNETQLEMNSTSSNFVSLDNSGFERDDDEVEEIELRGAVGGIAAAAAAAAIARNIATAASDDNDEEVVVFDAVTFL